MGPAVWRTKKSTGVDAHVGSHRGGRWKECLGQNEVCRTEAPMQPGVKMLTTWLAWSPATGRTVKMSLNGGEIIGSELGVSDHADIM